MKERKQGLRGFLAGVLTTVLVLGATTSALALSNPETIQCFMGGIKIFIDGQLQVPTDVNGNVVEPIIYNGTTYLPVRALTGMLTDKEVAWDSDTESVYIGLKPGQGEVIQLQELKAYGGGINTGSNAKFRLLGEDQTPVNSFTMYNLSNSYVNSSATYILNEQYTTLQGMLAVNSKAISSTAGGVKVYSVDRNGNETLLKEYSLAAGDDPIPVTFNIRGCYAIKIKAGDSFTVGECSGSSGVFYNVTITKAAAN